MKLEKSQQAAKVMPGNWLYGEYSSIGGTPLFEVVDSEQYAIASRVIGETNARLIAAAPDLLAACELIWKNHGLPEHLRVPLRDAIQRAKGAA